ncbi:MAG: septal ring lytic transglycosylase RlpA family protein, partial [Cyanobacteria bacterium J06560_2]
SEAAALLLSGITATLAGAQSTANQLSENKDVESIEATVASESEVKSAADAVASNTSPSNTSQSAAEEISAESELSPELSGDVSVYPHAIDGRQAATLYVKDIPVLTFIGTEVDSLSNSSDAVPLAAGEAATALQAEATEAGDILNSAQENDPVLRATDLGAQLDTEAMDAEALSVRWHEETDGYIVTLAGEDLIELDSKTILADTTEDAAEDALQVTNRLRRLIGDVAPVEEIEGLPEPEPAPVVAAAPTPAIAYSNVGGASWYGPGFHGRLTASGEVYNQYDITAAHRTLPFGTRVLVTNLYNGRQVTVRINDRGPYAGDRIIDLSQGAADVVGITSSGVGTVQLDILY